jgi:hypothetical protein
MSRKSIVLILAALALVLAGGILHVTLLDGLDGLLLSRFIVDFEDTRYASGYSDRAFRAVRVGMSTQEVLGLLGEPLERSRSERSGLDTWRYSVSPSDASYRVRVIQFLNGLASGKVHELYVD